VLGVCNVIFYLFLSTAFYLQHLLCWLVNNIIIAVRSTLDIFARWIAECIFVHSCGNLHIKRYGFGLLSSSKWYVLQLLYLLLLTLHLMLAKSFGYRFYIS